MFLDAFSPYDYLVRTSLLLVVATYSNYLMLRSGIFAVPQVGLFAIGSYAAAVLALTFNLGFVPGVLLATVITTLCGLCLGIALFRLNGLGLAIATIGFSEIVRLVLQNLEWAGGAFGLYNVPRATTDWMILGVSVACLVGFWRLARTRFGAAMDAMRADPELAAHAGVNARRYTIGAFAMAGVLCGAAGALTVHLTGYAVPTQFSFELLTTLLACAVLGGMTSHWGPILGAAVVFGAPEVLTPLKEYRYVLDGLLIIGVMALARTGLAGLLGFALGNLQTRIRGLASLHREPGGQAP